MQELHAMLVVMSDQTPEASEFTLTNEEQAFIKHWWGIIFPLLRLLDNSNDGLVGRRLVRDVTEEREAEAEILDDSPCVVVNCTRAREEYHHHEIHLQGCNVKQRPEERSLRKLNVLGPSVNGKSRR